MNAKQTAQRKVRLNVKLVPEVDRQRTEEVLTHIPGLQSVIQTFSDEMDKDLASLYIIEVDPSHVQSALKQLRRSPYVEYAEETARRKLVW
jgi:hypothetical protein